MRNNKKILIVGLIILLVMVGIFGVTYAMWTASRTLDNQVLVAGNVFMKYTETNELSINDAMPKAAPGEKDYFEFTIEGENTYSTPIYYEIVLNYGDASGDAGRTERIKDNLLMFKLVETKDGEDATTVLDNATYADLQNKKIWVNNIPANQSRKVTINYKLYMWISGKTIIGNTEDAVYDMETWDKVYASIKVSVNGDFNEKELDKNGVNIIKNTLGNKGGVIGINNTTNKKVIAVSNDIREYRYSGLDVNNYVYFNCTDGLEQNAQNCEKWRIVGIFKDESGAEHLKIVRNEVLKQTDFPDTYTESDVVYDIKSTNTQGDYAFWNKKASGSNNDWATAGLQYWLNAGYDVETKSPDAGYMSYLSKSAKGMIEDKTKYYLGTVTYYNKDMNGGSESVWGIKDTVNEAYKNERAVSGCEGGIGPTTNSNRDTLQNNATCRVWANNQATWEGRIALLYTSDYGYSADSKYWNTKMGYTTFNGTPSSSSWLQQSNHKFHEWLLSPSSCDAIHIANWSIAGDAYNLSVTHDYLGVRPCLYLKSNVKITSGDGSQENVYKLSDSV